MDASLLRRQLSEAGRLFDLQLRTLLQRDLFVRGSVYRLRRKCGKAGCRCTRGTLHESWVLLARGQGVRRMRAVPKGAVGRWKAWAQGYRRFRLARRELARQYQEIWRLVDQLEDARALPPPDTANKEGRHATFGTV
jgi:hypothetical protein